MPICQYADCIWTQAITSKVLFVGNSYGFADENYTSSNIIYDACRNYLITSRMSESDFCPFSIGNRHIGISAHCFSYLCRPDKKG